jgi:hypothetical protein
MSIRDRFENAVIDEASIDPERREQHAQNANPNSHKDFFASRRPRKLSDAVIGSTTSSEEEGVVLAHTDVTTTRQNLRRGEMLKEMVNEALVNRIQEPTGYKVMSMSFKDWTKMHTEYQEAEKIGRQGELPFAPASVYMQNLLYRRNGTLRERPIRPLLKGEVGQFLSGPHADKIIVVTENSPEDDGKLRSQVPSTFMSKLLELEPHPLLTEKQQEEAGQLGYVEDPIDNILEIAQK